MPRSTHALDRYREKRDFKRTREPSGSEPATSEGRSFCVQQHAAGRLHYDFRLELDGVLKSWAVPKGPSLVPGQRRLAVQVEDHPLEYGAFEGVIPEGEYGGGTVLLWDRGTWTPKGDPRRALAEGKLELTLEGEKLRGKFVLVRMKDDETQWLLIKSSDEHASSKGAPAVIDAAPNSVASERSIAQIAEDQGATAKQRRRAREVVHESEPMPMPMPEWIEPQLATLVDEAPEGETWIHEIKLDGYRVQCRIDGENVQVLTRNRIDRAHEVPAVVAALRRLEVTNAIIDGELVWFDDAGRTVFSKLVEALGKRGSGVMLAAFDMLYSDGCDLRGEPLLARKEILHELLDGVSPPLRYVDHFAGRGPEFLQAACEHRLEGIISKRTDAPHRDGRGRDWLKLKCLQRQELVIVGFTPPTHERDRFGSLVVAVHAHDGDGLVYAGRVGTGFDREDRKRVADRLESLVVDACPLPTMPRAPGLRRVQWVKPELVAEVAFSEWTPDGRLRHPSFQGLRDDKPASAVVREHPAPVNDVRAPTKRKAQASEPERPAGVTLTNPTKVLVADVGLTKLALAQYYETVAASMLPHLHGRALMLLRCPDGSDKPCFFQKHAGQSLPDGVIAFNLREQDGTRATYLAVESAQGLVGTVQMGALELHVWGSRRDAIDRPDRLVIDLDPDEELPFANVVIAASEVRDRLADAQLESFVMSTGGKGLHVVAPLDAVHPFEVVKAWARRFAEQLVRAAPTRYVATASKARRRGKIFLDYLRNGRGASAVCPFSTRSRPGAPVAVPLAWEELADMDVPPHVGIDAAVQRVTEGEDPWAGYFALEQRL